MCTIVASPSYVPEENCNVFTPVTGLPPGTLDTDGHLVHCRAEPVTGDTRMPQVGGAFSGTASLRVDLRFQV